MATTLPLNSIVKTLRVVVHTMGLAGWDKSRNHWSIYLVLEGNSTSVRLNMSLLNGGDTNGTLSITPHEYVESNSTLTFYKYNIQPGLNLRQILQLIYSNGREKYRMTDSGNGCRFWIWTIFVDFFNERYIIITENEKNAMGQRMQMRYHRNTVTQQVVAIPDAMELGEFF